MHETPLLHGRRPLVQTGRSAHHSAMRRYRFHSPDLSGDVVTVTGAEARHAASVLRVKAGDEVELFDGQGSEVTGIVQAIDAESMAIAIRLRMTKSPESLIACTSLILATAIPKGPRADWMVEKCAELGVAELWPIHFERSVVDPGTGKLDRWRRLTLAAAKQSGSATAMTIAEPGTMSTLIAGIGRSACVFGLPNAAPGSLADELQSIGRGTKRFDPVIVVIGPEGGLSSNELLYLVNAGAMPVSWARAVLRIETAAIAAAAVFASYAAGYAPQDS